MHEVGCGCFACLERRVREARAAEREARLAWAAAKNRVREVEGRRARAVLELGL